MKDWQGNDIKEGQTLIAVAIKPAEQMSAPIIIDPASGEVRMVQAMAFKGPAYIWYPYIRAEVIDRAGELCLSIYSRHQGAYIAAPIQMVEEVKNDFVEFCIEGVSDNEEEFFKNYFKPHMN